MSTKHRYDITDLYHAVQYRLNGRCIVVDRALIDSVVIINSRTGEHEAHGQPVDVRRGRDGEWLIEAPKDPVLA